MTDDIPLPATAARLLLRSARAATLATQTDGQPFASLVTPAPTIAGALLMLLSGLSEHTRHLRTEPRCSLLLAAPSDDPNPQASARLTLTGMATLQSEPLAKSRWVARHPYAAFYAGFADFTVWAFQPHAGLYIGGFASATRLSATDLLPPPAAAAALMQAEVEILSHCNADHADTLAIIARHHGLPDATWQMTACDTDGFDLSANERVQRIAWPSPAASAQDVRASLVALARAARQT